jgi:branched-chain amino acid transport system permease protein
VVGPNGAEGFRHVRYVFDRGFTGLHYLGIIAAALAIVVVLFYLLERSKIGAKLRAVEEDETAAAMVGINVTRVKVLAFAAAATVAGLGGGLFIHYSTYIDHDMVALPLAIASVTYPLLGGLGSFVGTLLGAIVLVGLTEGLRVLHELREFVYGGLIILTMIFRPRGIVDEAFVLRVKSWFAPRAARRPVQAP